MPPCEICGDNTGLGYTCNECGGKYCSDHRLPENHDCHPLQYRDRPKSFPNRSSSSSGTDSGSGAYLIPVVVMVLGILLLSAVSGLPALDTTGAAATEAANTKTADSAAGGAATTTQHTTTTAADTSVSEDEIEAAIHARVNEIRESRGLSTLQVDGSFTTAARYHSEEMAERGELYHGDIRARYGSQCSAIGENVAQTYADGTLMTDNGTVDYDHNETRIGEGIVRQWMNSDGHRENILSTKWSAEGVGVHVTETDDGKPIVYATQGFCGG